VVDGPLDLVGAEVWGSGGDLGFTRDGTHAELIALPRSAVAHKPARLSFDEAAAVGTPFVTAWSALLRGSLVAGDRVLVVGAAGAVGSGAVRLARWRGALVIGLVRSEAHAAVARELGAARVAVAAHGVDPLAALRGALGEDTIDLAFDTSGQALDACV